MFDRSPDQMPGTSPAPAEDRLVAEAAQLRAQPGFPQALRAYTAGLAEFRETSRLFSKAMANEARFRTVRYLIYLDSDRERFGEDGGASYGRLLDLCTRRHEIGPRVLKTMLALMTLTGLVRSRRGTTDSRQKFYHPTPRLLALARQRLVNAARALDILEPQLQRTRMMLDDPQAVRRMSVSAGREHTMGDPPTDRMPEFIAYYGGQEGAAPLVFTVMQADFDRTPLPSRAAIARRFGLSKTQVSNLITEGARQGYLTLDGRGVPAATPHLRDSFQRWISIELAYHARHMRRG